MAGISKYVRSRLRQSASAQHPDPNLLAGFAERTLIERERAAVTAHLAECGDCREYLALAFAYQFEQPKPRRFNAMAWRWLAAAAAACVMLGIFWPRRIEPPKVAAPVKSPETVIAGIPQRAFPPSAPEVKRRAAPKPRTEAKPAEVQQLQKKTEIAAGQPQKEQLTQNPQFTENQLQVQAQSQSRQQAETQVEADSAAPPANSPPPVIGGMKSSAVSGFAPMARQASAPVPLRARWTINAAGMLERSFDAGQTWEPVPVGEDVTFRAVAATGPEVWAGGSRGALFHSSDNGIHWVRVPFQPASTIVSIDAATPGRVKVTTSTGEEWLTTDNGLHWNR